MFEDFAKILIFNTQQKYIIVIYEKIDNYVIERLECISKLA